MTPTTRARAVSSKTAASGAGKKPPSKPSKPSTKSPAKAASKAATKKRTKDHTKAKAPAVTVMTGAVKTPKKKATTARTSKGISEIPDSPVNYCETDLRQHGTYLRCGTGALYMPTKRKRLSDKNTLERVTKRSKAGPTGLKYDFLVRNGARMVLQGLNDLCDKINDGPVDLEPSLEGVREHMSEAMKILRESLESGDRYIGPTSDLSATKKFEEGDGLGNWITFKPSWFERGKFDVGDTVLFQSTLQDLKAHGEVVSLHL